MTSKDLRAAILGLLERFSVASYLFQHEICARLELHPTDFLSLHILDQRGPLAAGALSREIGLTSGATTAAIDRLLSAGFVRRVHDPGDRRRVLVEIDERGTSRLRQHYKPIDSMVEKALSVYSQKELETIRGFLEKVTGAEDAPA